MFFNVCVYLYIYIFLQNHFPPKPNTQELQLPKKSLCSKIRATSLFPCSACRGKMPGSLHEARNNITWPRAQHCGTTKGWKFGQ